MSLNGTCQSHITVCHFAFLLIAFYHITHSNSPHYVSFPSPSLCFVSSLTFGFHRMAQASQAMFPDATSAKGPQDALK